MNEPSHAVTETGQDPAWLAQPDPARLMPSIGRKRSLALPILVVISLLVHASVLLPILFPLKRTTPAAPTETPVEIIQEAPVEAKKDKESPSKESAKDAEADKAKAEQMKAEQAKAEQAKAAEQAKEQAQARVADRMRDLLGQPPPSLDAAALPGESANGTENASYQQLVLSKLTKALGFEKHVGKPGFTTVTFVVGDNGELTSVALQRPSGDPILDAEAVAVVKRGAPYPAPPPGGKREYTVTLETRPVL